MAETLKNNNIEQNIDSSDSQETLEGTKPNEVVNGMTKSTLDSFETEVSAETLIEAKKEFQLIGSDYMKKLQNYLGDTSSTDFENFSEFKNNPKVRSTIKYDEEGMVIGYNLINEIQKIIDLQTRLKNLKSESVEIQQIEYEAATNDLLDANLRLRAIIDDSRKIEGEKTFGEKRLDTVHNIYNEIYNLDPALSDILDIRGEKTLYEDIRGYQVNALKHKGIDIKKLFLVKENGEQMSDKFIPGETYTVTFGNNETLAKDVELVNLTIDLQEVKVDGELLTFKQNGPEGIGYYDKSGYKRDIYDGAKIEVISLRNDSKPEQNQELQTALDEYTASQDQEQIAEDTFNSALLQDPDAELTTDHLPKTFGEALLLVLTNLLSGKNALSGILKNETRENNTKIIPKTETTTTFTSFIDNEGEKVEKPVSNRDFIRNYVESETTLGTLSARYESSGSPTNHNMNDNGHGISFGTYQMNEQVGVAKGFAKEMGINLSSKSPQARVAAWNAKVKELGTEAFHKKEWEYIKKNNYDRMMSQITLSNFDKSSLAVKNVIWSSAVQHGPNRKLILKVINDSKDYIPGDPDSERKLINRIFDARARLYPPLRNSRYKTERNEAIKMLETIGFVNMDSEEGKVQDIIDIYDQGIDGSFSGITSSPFEKSKNGVTLCSRTARKNLANLGIKSPKQGSSAKASFELYPKSKIDTNLFPPDNTDAKVADIYLDASPKNRKYGHRAAAFKQNGEWFVLDPYYRMPPNKHANRNPIPADVYIDRMIKQKGRKFWGAVYFK